MLGIFFLDFILLNCIYNQEIFYPSSLRMRFFCTDYIFPCPMSTACHGTWRLYLYSMVNGVHLSRCTALISVHLIFFLFQLLPPIVVPLISAPNIFVDILIKKLCMSFISAGKFRKSWRIGYGIYGFDLQTPYINVSIEMDDKLKLHFYFALLQNVLNHFHCVCDHVQE